MKRIVALFLICITIITLSACDKNTAQKVHSGNINQTTIDWIFNQCLTNEERAYNIVTKQEIAKTDYNNGMTRFLMQNGDTKYYLEIQYLPAKTKIDGKEKSIDIDEYYYSVKLYQTDWFKFDLDANASIWSADIMGAKVVKDIIIKESSSQLSIVKS